VPDRLPADRKKRTALMANLPLEMQEDYWRRRQAAMDPLNAFLRSEQVAAVLRVDQRGAGGFLFAESAGSFKTNAPEAPPSIVLAPEQYNRLWRLTEKHLPVEVAVDLKASFIENPFIANVIGEIPGTSKKDEIVMLGAHLDSWHAGTGATDNAAGCAVMLEAMRILKTLQLKMDRTVRVALWSGEEQGLYGSRAYVRDHFGDAITMELKPEHAKLAAYFNVDNGSGRIRGIHLQGNDMARPIFEAWLAPFKDLGADTISIRDTGGTDHLSFDAVGLPGFQFIQDPLDYGSRTHHSDMDVYDHVEPGDLMQAAAIVASFAYNAATRTEMIPRKPLPKPLSPKPAPTPAAVETSSSQ
jgi:Zn-dependent M28 family amino/carboxypeptidase